MNDWAGEETEVICSELGVTANHLGVMLHRARRHMRKSLQGCGVSSPGRSRWNLTQNTVRPPAPCVSAMVRL